MWLGLDIVGACSNDAERKGMIAIADSIFIV
jgi:hypothetical protein